MHVKLLLGILVTLTFAIGLYGQSPSSTPNPAETGHNPGVRVDTISGNTYHNADLGFRYEFPAGWTINDKATQSRAIAAGRQFVWADDMSAKREATATDHCSKSLLLVTKYPEEMQLNEFNSLALLIAADPKCLGGIPFPDTVKDQPAIQQIASHLGVYFKTSTTTPLGPPRVRAFENAGRIMLEVTEGFSIYRHEPGTSTVQRIRSSVLVVKAERYWIMWMFASADDVQFEKLRATRIFFD